MIPEAYKEIVMRNRTCLKASTSDRRSGRSMNIWPQYRRPVDGLVRNSVETPIRGSHLFLIDTNVVSALGKPWANPRVVSWIDAAPTGSLAISWSTVFELQYGVESARNAGSHRADAYESALSALIEDPRFQVLGPTTEAARIRGRMHATAALRNFLTSHPGSKKRTTGEDLMIAATAIAAGAVIVTSNVRDFLAIDKCFRLPGLIDPDSGEWVVSPPENALFSKGRSDDPTEKPVPIGDRSVSAPPRGDGLPART